MFSLCGVLVGFVKGTPFVICPEDEGKLDQYEYFIEKDMLT